VGGDEFLVLLPDTDEDGAARLAERIRAQVSDTPVDNPGGPFHVTVTIGCASGATVDPGELVRAADAALYAAKARGRNRVDVSRARLRDKGDAITVLIVDDHRLEAEGLSRLIGREEDLLVVGVVTTANAALEAAKVITPDVVLLDYALPDADGVSTARLLRQSVQDSKVIIVTAEPSDEIMLRVVGSDCSSHVDKTEAPDVLVSTIRLVHAGDTEMFPTRLRSLASLPRRGAISTSAMRRTRS
jgi:PleD family two-component response regulator